MSLKLLCLFTYVLCSNTHNATRPSNITGTRAIKRKEPLNISPPTWKLPKTDKLYIYQHPKLPPDQSGHTLDEQTVTPPTPSNHTPNLHTAPPLNLPSHSQHTFTPQAIPDHTTNQHIAAFPILPDNTSDQQITSTNHNKSLPDITLPVNVHISHDIGHLPPANTYKPYK